MKLLRFVLLSAAAVALAGCSDDDGPVVAPNEPLAATRYINAMPDTGTTTWRFVDKLENSPVFIGLAFREFTPYQATGVGQRPLKVFSQTEDIRYSNVTFADTTLTLQEGKHYSLIQLGMARAGSTPSERLWVLEDVFPTVPANQIAIRFVHTGAGLGPIDVYSADALIGPSIPATPLVSNLAFGTASPYVLINATASTDLASIAATATGYTRTTGSFITDGFRVGQQILPSRFSNAANNTRSTVLAVTATTLTIGPSTGSASIGVTSGGFTRTTGSFIDEGLAKGMRFTSSGFATEANNATFVIDTITATRITVGSATALTDEAEAAGRTLTKANVTEAEAPGRLILGEMVFRATNAGTTTRVAQLTAPAGLPEEPIEQLEVVGGTAMPGSVMSAFFMPRSVASSKAPSFTTPNWVYVIDKHPR